MHPSSEDLFSYRDGELGPEKRAVVEAHVMGCSVCRALIDQVSALEAELRRSPDAAPAGYFDGLSESIRARLTTVSSEPVAVGHEAGATRTARAESGVEDARVEREGRREKGRVKEAPKLPWAAVIGTASAAVAVLVVVVILIRQGPYQRMVMPERRSVPKSAVVNEGQAKDQAQNAPSPSIVTAPSVPVPPESDDRAKERAALSREDRGLRDQLAKKADEVAGMKAPAAAQAPAEKLRAPELSGGAEFKDNAEELKQESEQKISSKPSAEPRARQAPASGEGGYQAILARFGLPPLWDASVTPDALANAEPDLRSYYMSGNAGADSARVRLYLAEAARLRYGPGDTELYEEIQHHYQRVIEMAGSDAEVARVARERLRSLER